MTEPRITRDREEIEAWANEHNAIPIREGDRIRLVPESDVGESHERLEWDAFHQEVDEQDHVVTYHGETEDREPFEVGNRADVIDRVTAESDFDRDEAEQRLIEGETITGTITETTVVEETIVERATVESEVVDRDTVEQNVVDVELLNRECQSCDVVADTAETDHLSTYGTDRFVTDDVQTGSVEQYDEYPFDVTVDVHEDWAVTIEQVDRYTVETHITDVDTTETDEVEKRDLEARIDVDAVHEQLLGSDGIDLDIDTHEGEVRDTETYDIESEFTGDDVLTTYLTSRRRFRREISDRSRLTTQVVEGELLDREIVSEEDVEAGLVESDTSTTDTEVETDEEVSVASDTDTEVETREGIRVTPESEDEGKTVVDANGDEIGEVIDVEDGVAYVDVHPSLTKRVMSKLGADENEDTYLLREDRIERITDDEVVVSTDSMDENSR